MDGGMSIYLEAFCSKYCSSVCNTTGQAGGMTNLGCHVETAAKPNSWIRMCAQFIGLSAD